MAAMLCDYATSRDGLLTIVNGGIDHWAPPNYPAQLEMSFAGLIELDDRDQDQEHAFAIDIVDENACRVGGALGTFKVEGSLGPGETTKFPIALSLASITIAGYGDYELRCRIDDETYSAMSLRAMAV